MSPGCVLPWVSEITHHSTGLQLLGAEVTLPTQKKQKFATDENILKMKLSLQVQKIRKKNKTSRNTFTRGKYKGYNIYPLKE